MSNLLFPFSEEHEMILQTARAFAQEKIAPIAAEFDESGEFPHKTIQKMGEMGFMGIEVPEEYGGAGLDTFSYVLALEEIGVLGSSLACLFSLPSIVGEAINVFGSREQKEKYLKPMLAGNLTVAEALTEPRGGSDFFGATTTARREGDVYILNGQKVWSSDAHNAEYGWVLARTDPTVARQGQRRRPGRC